MCVSMFHPIRALGFAAVRSGSSVLAAGPRSLVSACRSVLAREQTAAAASNFSGQPIVILLPALPVI
jgi:hypothetical protein